MDRSDPLKLGCDEFTTIVGEEMGGGKKMAHRRDRLHCGIPDSLESGLRSTRGVHLAGSDDVACKIVQNHLPGGLKM